MFFMTLLGAFTVVGLLVGAGGCLYYAYRSWKRQSYDSGLDTVMGTVLGALLFGVLLLVLAMVTGGFSSDIAPGCYRISSTTSSGTAVTVGPKGQVGVTPIVLSGRTYEPIACPS